MALYGDNLARAARPGSTWSQATDILGALEDGIRQCYASLSLWDNWRAKGIVDTINLAVLSAIVPDDAVAMKGTLDSELGDLYAFDTMVQSQADALGWNTAIADDYLATLQGRIQTSSSAIALCDSLFHTSIIGQVSDAIVPVVGNLGDQIGNGLSKLLGNFLGGIWWVIALALAALVFWRKYRPIS